MLQHNVSYNHHDINLPTQTYTLAPPFAVTNPSFLGFQANVYWIYYYHPLLLHFELYIVCCIFINSNIFFYFPQQKFMWIINTVYNAIRINSSKSAMSIT